MKRPISYLLTLATLGCLLNAQGQSPVPAGATNADLSKIFKSDKEKLGYALGMNTATSLKGNLAHYEIEIDPEATVNGFMAALESKPTLITEEQEKEVLGDLRKMISAKMEEKRKQLAEENRVKGEKNKAEGTAFLEKNKSANGIVVLPSGLQYKILTDGTGPAPKPTDEVTVKYRGTLIDGTEFDSSAKHGKDFTTRVQGGVIKGWTEALELMKVGSKWQIIVPPDLAYGANGAGQVIGPESTLIFEIELLSINSDATPHVAPAPLTSDIIKVPSAEEIKKGAKIETIKAEDIEKEMAKTNK